MKVRDLCTHTGFHRRTIERYLKTGAIRYDLLHNNMYCNSIIRILRVRFEMDRRLSKINISA